MTTGGSPSPPDPPRGTAARPVRLTVRDVLALPVLRRGLPQVVAGVEALDRSVRWVHAGEVAHMASQLQGGELFLTTGMGIGARPADQRRFVADLAARGISALVVELGTSLTELPQALVDAAEQQQLVLVALAREVPFVAVTEALHTEIINAQYALVRRGDHVQERLTDLLLQGHGIPEVLHETAVIIGNPVFLEDGDGRLLYHAGSVTEGVDPLAAWRAATAPSGRPPWRAGIAAPVPTSTHGRPGRLLVLPVAGPLDDVAEVALQRAASIVTLVLLRSRHEEGLVVRERGDFLSDLAHGRIAADDAATHAASIGMHVVGRLLLPIAACPTVGTDAAPWGTILRDVVREVSGSGTGVLVGQEARSGYLLALLTLRDAGQREAVAGRFARALRRAAEPVMGSGAISLVVGDPTPWDTVGTELRLARDSVAATVALDPTPWHDVRALELHRLLWGWRSEPQLRELVRRRLGPLLKHDASHKHQLLPTLDALCRHGWSKSQAARALHVNRQGLYARVERIEALLGVDLADPEQAMTVHVALRALPYVRGPDAP